MAFDPISVLVAGVAAAGMAVQGSPLPPPAEDIVSNVVVAVESAAPEVNSQLAPYIEWISPSFSTQAVPSPPQQATLPGPSGPTAPVPVEGSTPTLSAEAEYSTPGSGALPTPAVVRAEAGSPVPVTVSPTNSMTLGTSTVPPLVFDPNIPHDIEVARRVIEAALTALGLPYQWGGGALNGPTMGDGTGGATAGYDCSGLVRFAVYQATGRELPRTSQIQFTVGTQISWDSAQPGDLVFGNWQTDGANHVAIYLGEGRMIEAPQTGQLVQISDVRSDMVPVRMF